jgi:GNAT superfamily N-acetyltransferase
MLALIKELAHYENAAEKVTVSLDHFKSTGFGEQPIWWAFVATQDDIVIGMALYYMRYSTWKGKMIYLEDFIVKEAYRGNNIGQQLFDAVIEEGKHLDCAGLTLQVLDWNEPAINFYKKNKASLDSEWINATIFYHHK